jgi:4-amino-4-deoxy-L-arabinose transferase-like glycosyltransferase
MLWTSFIISLIKRRTDTERTTSRTAFFLLGVLLVFSFFANFNSVPLFDEDEGAYAEVSREMVVNNDFINPTLNGKPFFHKPVFLYWLQAASISIFGLNEGALRLPSSIASLLWAVAIFLFTRRYYSPPNAFYATVLMASSLQVTLIGKAAIPDALLNLFITCSMFAIFSYYQSRSTRMVWLAFFCIGLGVLTKGPIALLIPLVVSFLFFSYKGEWRLWLRCIFNPAGLLIFALIVLPWYVSIYMSHGGDFFYEFIIKHNIGRYQSSMEGHSGPVYYYLPVLLAGLLPFTGVFFKAAGRYRLLKQDDRMLFLSLWFVFVFIFFSLAQTKLHHYVVYGYTPLFILMADAFKDIKHSINLVIWPAGLIILLFLLPDIGRFALPYIDDNFARSAVLDALAILNTTYRIFTAAVLIGIVTILFVKRISKPVRTVLLGILFISLLNFLIIPIVGEIQQQPIKDAALYAKEKGQKVVVWQMNYPSFNVYSEMLTEDRPPVAGDIILTKSENIEKLKEVDVISQKHGIVMALVLEP